MNVIDQYFPVLLLIMLHKVILTFQSVDEILTCDHSNESFGAVVSGGAVYTVIWETIFKIVLYKVVLAFESVDEIVKCGDHSNESCLAVLSCDAVYYAVQGGSNF